MALERSFRFETKRLEEKIRRRLAETPLAERSIMRQIAARMRKEAIARAPKDIGTLEHSILDMVAQTPNGYAAVVYVPVNACVVETSDGRSFSYAVAMHENHYELGPKSAAKQAKGTVVVGRKYLSRAVSENRELFNNMIAWNLKKWGWK